MTQPLQKLHEATQLAQLWDSYFPSKPVSVESWRLLLDRYDTTTITKAMQRCVKKSIRLNGNITVPQMLSYVQSICYNETQEIKP